MIGEMIPPFAQREKNFLGICKKLEEYSMESFGMGK